MTLIALSATYGAGGSVVGPELADRLGVPFVDRAIPTKVAETLDVPLVHALEHDENVGSLFERMLKHFAPLSGAYVSGTASEALLGTDVYCEATERVICEHAEAGEGVILGRASAYVLRDRPHVLRVRLDGPEEARLDQAMRIQGIDRDTAAERMRQTDRARDAYVRHFYGADPRDTSVFHLLVDSTAIGLGACTDLIARASEARNNG
ncbi:MAG TPA: cytidylate kinase-like family protein [Thermoleophilaceae bacterium]|jgi:cytidylate kinase